MALKQIFGKSGVAAADGNRSAVGEPIFLKTTRSCSMSLRPSKST